MNKKVIQLIRFILISGFLFAAGCSDNSNDAAVTSNTDTPTSEVSPVIDPLPTYPVSQLPEGLVWITNNDDPVFASPDARKGGAYRAFMSSFPSTLRVHGPDSNSGLAPYVRALSMSLTELHPNTMKRIPSLATHWAYGSDKKTVYYKLDPNARWSDGKPITADDYMFTYDFMRSEYILDPWSNNQYTNDIINISKYDDYTISVTGSSEKPGEDIMYYYGIAPTARHFHKLDKNWVQDYDWKIAPTPGPYKITKVEKGKYVEFSLVDDWWAKDLKYNKNRYNYKTFRLTVIREVETAYRHFLRGELDTFGLLLPNYWYDRSEDDVFRNGYVHRIWFYNDLPQPSYGMYLNMDDEIFKDQNLRYGFAHAMNIQKMIDTVLRGDYMRMPSIDIGYGDYTNKNIKPREFDLKKAGEYLNKAGWSERGSDGIRIKDGKRLSVRLTYSQQYHTDRIVVLQEDAKKAGIEIQLQLLDPAAAFKSFLEKKHQIAWTGLSTGLRPDYWGQFHSINAHKPQTNNFTNTDDPALDALIENYDKSTSAEERQTLSKEIQQKIHDIGAYIPTYMLPYIREGYWRWMKLPKWYGTKTSDTLFDPIVSGLAWIDEEEKERTLAAMKAGEKFEPVTIIDETYKVQY